MKHMHAILALNIGLILAAIGLPYPTSSIHAAESGFAFTQTANRLVITRAGEPVATYVFQDDKIQRPYFANLRAPGGIQVTRHHPPIAGLDATDHDTMHPGLWLAFGDISGNDFWRNQGTIRHQRFVAPPTVRDGQLTFATENELLSSDGKTVCTQTSRILIKMIRHSYLLVWDATFHSDGGGFTFGDQEEMGLGVRVATPITEKNGGLISNSTGASTAKATWGRAFDWCDYSGIIESQRVGVTLMPDPKNFRPSWWHNRDYGLMVANPFGRKAMKQGAASQVYVKKGERLHLRFGVLLHASPKDQDAGLGEAYRHFLELAQ